MLQFFSPSKHQLETVNDLRDFPLEGAWYDLLCPNNEEVKGIEAALHLHIPSLEEMSEIEESSRLYEENGNLYMTFLVIASADKDNPITTPSACILTRNHLITVRYIDTKPFKTFAKKVSKNGFVLVESLFLGLIETVIERIADILETNATEIETISRDIFKKNHISNQREMGEILIHIGQAGDLNSKIRESLETIDRQLIFYRNQIEESSDKKLKSKIATLQKDVKSLVDYGTFLFSKIELLLEASLGFINIEQNTIIKIFSVAAVIFLPPMLVASIYGMNFIKMPELSWYFGYPFALLLMTISGFLPYIYFKYKGWL